MRHNHNDEHQSFRADELHKRFNFGTDAKDRIKTFADDLRQWNAKHSAS
jgi:hypothetical protein